MRTALVVLFFLATVSIMYPYFPGEKVVPDRRTETRMPAITFLTSDRVEYETPLDGVVTLAIYDIRGNVMPFNGVTEATGQPSGGHGVFRFTLDGSPSGMYFVLLRNQAGVAARGVIHLR